MDYLVLKRQALAAIANIGRELPSTRSVVTRLTFAQRKRLTGKNFFTPDFWQYRLIGDKLVEIAHGSGIGGGHVIGVSVFHLYGEDSARADMDRNASGPVNTVDELAEKLRGLNDGGDSSSKYHEREYKLSFVGRETGALGITYSITATVTAHDDKSARLALYDRYEHIGTVNEIMPDGSTRRLVEA